MVHKNQGYEYMRKGFVYFFLLFVALIFFVFYFFVEKWVESAIETSIESITGAKVEIDNLDIKYFPLEVRWKRMQIANPYNTMTNLIETGDVFFKLDVNQLLRKKIIIDTIQVNGLLLGTKRTSDGALPEKIRKKSTLFLAEKSFTNSYKNLYNNILQNIPLFEFSNLKDNFNPDSIIKKLNIKTYYYIDTLKSRINHSAKQWDYVINDFNNSRKEILERIEEIKKIEVAKLKTPQSIINTITTVDNTINTINQIKSTYESRFNSIENEVNNVVQSIDSVRYYVDNDYNNLKKMARLPDITTPNIAPILIGNEVYSKVHQYLSYAEMLNVTVKKYKPKPDYEKPERLKGQNIKFPVQGIYPKFLIKEILVTGGKPGQGIFVGKGRINNITDNQPLINKPLMFLLDGALTNNRKLILNGVIDRRTNNSIDNYSLTFSQVPVVNIKLGHNNFLPSEISRAFLSTTLNITIREKYIDLLFNSTFDKMEINFENQPKSIIQNIIYNTLKNINKINVSLRFWNDNNKYDIAFKTNLDEIIAAELKKSVGNEISKLQNQLKAKFDEYINAKVQELNRIYLEKVKPVETKINEYRTLIENQKAIIEEKRQELKNKLESEKKNLIENKLRSLIK